MKQKIFGSILFLAVIATLISTFLIFWVMYGRLFNNVKQGLRNDAGYISSAMELYGPGYLDEFASTGSAASRITHIAADGTVLFDNYAAASSAENHLDRPEVISAIDTGWGEATRLSDTLDKKTVYYAVRLSDGSVLRVANTTDSAFASVMDYVPYIILVVAVISILAAIIASRQTKRIIEPLNKLDLENPSSNETYDELAPILHRLTKQNAEIRAHLYELQHKRDEFAAITENMREGLVLLSATGYIITINQSAKGIFGAADADYAGRQIFTLNRDLKLRQIIENAGNGIVGEVMLPQKEHYYQFISNPVTSGEKVRGIVLLILDVTEKHAAEQMRKEFSANVSHELKTPLQSISGYAEIIKNGLVRPEDVPRFVDRIFEETGRLIALVEDIIKLSRLDEDSELPREAVDLYALAKKEAKNAEPQAEKKNVLITVRGESTVINGVVQVLSEMVRNLIDNAVKYNRDDGRVDIGVYCSGSYAVLSVTDTGIGIPPEQQDRVFERFYRVDKSHSKETGGTGLGLSIVKHGALIHNAKINLSSEENEYTKIRILFPVGKNM